MRCALDDPEYDWTDEEDCCPVGSANEDFLTILDPGHDGSFETVAETVPIPVAAPRRAACWMIPISNGQEIMTS